MRRRSPRSATPLRRRQEELARQESELRDRVEQLERRIAAAPRVAEEASRRQHEEQCMQAKMGSRFDVAVALHDERYGGRTRRRPLRKERREGRMVFLVLMIALAVAVIWLMGHLHF